MSIPVTAIPVKNLLRLGLRNSDTIHYQLPPDELIQDSMRTGEGVLNDTGALVIRTGEFTGRAPKDKFIVVDDITKDSIHWNDFNIPIDPENFNIIHKNVMDYLQKLPEIWIRD